jgi:hypothetical protein
LIKDEKPRQFTFWTVLSRLTKPFLEAYYVFEADLSQQRSFLPAKPDFRVRLYHGAADLHAAIDALVPAGLSVDDISARLQRGDLVAVGVIGDQPAAYTWVSFTEASVKELGMKVCDPVKSSSMTPWCSNLFAAAACSSQ